MSAFLLFLLNTFIILGSLGGCLAAVALVVFNTRGWTERIVRGLAIFAGTLVVIGAEAAGLTFSSFAVNSLTHHGGLAGWLIKGAWVVLGGGAGALLARYLISRIDGGSNLQIRIMILVTIIAHVELLEIYAQNFKRNHFTLGIGALPDIAFIAGLVLYVVFRYDTGEARAIRARLGGRAGLTWLGHGGQREHERQELMPASVDEEYPNIFGEQSGQPREPHPWA
jgi:hypothetical protein